MSKTDQVGYILLYGSLRTGGIETLIVRMTAALIRKGTPVTVICQHGSLVASLPSEAQVVLYTTRKSLVDLARTGGITPLGASSYILVTFDPISAARGLLLESMQPQVVSHLSGVFHTRAYFMTGIRRDRVALNRLVARAVGFKHLFFMNDECRRSHAETWRADLTSCPILPLPVDTCDMAWKSPHGKSLRIVSVGRLVDFKAYNLGAPAIVQECAANGVNVAWDIFGTGPLKDEILREVSLHGLDGIVRLRGELPYADFGATVCEYDLFVGVGTAALEAAMVGVPVICGVDSERRLCYGFLDNLPFGNVGETQLCAPDISMSRLISEFAESSEAERCNRSIRCRSAAERYDMRAFLAALSELGKERSDRKAMRRLVGWIYYLIVDSDFVEWLRRAKAIWGKHARS